MVLPSSEQVTALSNSSWPSPEYGPLYSDAPSSPVGMSSMVIA